MYPNAPRNACTRLTLRIEVVLLQVATTSRGNKGRALQRGGGNVQNARTWAGNVAPQAPPTSTTRAQGNRPGKEGPAEVLAIREGEELPDGYEYVVRTGGKEGAAHVSKAAITTDTVDLTTPPEGEVMREGETSTQPREGQL